MDIDECQVGPCPVGAVCNNEPGSYSCQCPGGATGDPYKDGCSQLKVHELQSLAFEKLLVISFNIVSTILSDINI